jgi:hypothetical protein
MFKGVHRQTDISQDVWGMKHCPPSLREAECCEDRQTDGVACISCFFWFKWVLDRGPEQRESEKTVLYPQIIII